MGIRIDDLLRLVLKTVRYVCTVCDCRALADTQWGADKNRRWMRYDANWFCDERVQTYFLSRRNVVWRDCRRLREAKGSRGVLVRVRGRAIPPWTLCYSLRRPKRWWIWRGWVFRKGGFALLQRENSTPRRWESVRNLCTLTNVVGHDRLGIAPTTVLSNKQVAMGLVSQEWKKSVATCSMVAGGLMIVTLSVWLKKSFSIIYSKYHWTYTVFNWKKIFFNPEIPGFGILGLQSL